MVGLLLGRHTTITITIQPSNLMIQVPELAQPVQFLSVHSLIARALNPLSFLARAGACNCLEQNAKSWRRQ